ncbi:precorrin-6A synthase (deacetylating) [Rhizobium sp. LjRoot98]|uniref:precorrin-6A synthase (deacetylating) n=1 Tax=unclassified Rhizobium TaxID=2613769 RepID=UPI000713F5AD|nr:MULTISPECIES: precorrin-6A synthase (deacetylating) [unclassified Rhizobium]KQV39003.1 precorrin 6A synthase [Rhizobium sp. Root1204]KQY16033.1 precorrin 6A synthase [Rhizobium sp. Root1334]KRC10208.1 precorrin 6A synthase [Rhizobium sp. Root73]
MRNILVVGIGAGNPEHMTVQAINALNKASVLFIPTKGDAKAQLADIRRDIVSRYVTNPRSRVVEFEIPVRQVADRSYHRSVDEWHAAISSAYERLLTEELDEGQTGAFLVWGDPMLYDSTIRIIERVRALKTIVFDYAVIPGITSIQALAASHRIPLNLVGKPVEITTGRRLTDSFPQKSETAVVMLDGEQAFMKIDDPGARIYWGAYLGTEQEIIISGRLADVRDDILKARASARALHGWIMDIYLLQKGADFEE